MSKIKVVERSIKVIAGQYAARQMVPKTGLVEAICAETSDEAQIMASLAQGMDA